MSREFELRGEPPTLGERINELHVWIAIDKSGNEGIISVDVQTEFGKRHMPLMSSRKHLAESLGELAHNLLRESVAAGQALDRVELRSFKMMTQADRAQNGR